MGWLTGRHTPKVHSLANQKNFATTRFGQQYTEEDIRTEVRRNPYFNFIGSKIYDFAFADGFEVCDSKLDETDNVVEDLTVELVKQRVLNSLIDVAKKDAQYGSSSTFLFEAINRFDEPFTEIKSFRPSDVRFDFYDESALGDLIKQVQVEEKLPGNTSRITKIPATSEDFANFFFVRTRPSDAYPHEGVSELDAVWDVGMFANVILEAAMVASVRVAFGIREATIWDRKGDTTEDDAVMAAVEGGLKALESGDTSIIMRGFIDQATGQPVKDEIKVHTGEINFPYDAMLDMAHKVMSMQTGIPKNYFDGIFQGSLVGAEVVDEQLESAKKNRREHYKDVFTDIIRRWCVLNGFEWKDSYYIHWLQEEILTEREKAEIENIQANTDVAYVDSYIKSAEEVRTLRGLSGPAPEKPNPMDLGTLNISDQQEEEPDDEQEEEAPLPPTE